MMTAKYNAFGHLVAEKKIPVDASNGMRSEYTLTVDKETLTTYPVKTGEVDTDAEVQTYKDQCGMTYILDLISRGLATPSSFQDNGDMSGDGTVIPQNIHELQEMAARNNKAVSELSEALGLSTSDISSEDFDKILETKIAAIVAKKAEAVKEEPKK